jgi:C-terminal processing protease CtpA/Prc
VRITISRWFTPEHNSVAPDGIQPDIDAARTAETQPDEDPVLDAALDYLADQPVAGDETGAAPDPGTDRAAAGVPSADPVVGIVGRRAVC